MRKYGRTRWKTTRWQVPPSFNLPRPLQKCEQPINTGTDQQSDLRSLADKQKVLGIEGVCRLTLTLSLLNLNVAPMTP